jgi:hypothetical protein
LTNAEIIDIRASNMINISRQSVSGLSNSEIIHIAIIIAIIIIGAVP